MTQSKNELIEILMQEGDRIASEVSKYDSTLSNKLRYLLEIFSRNITIKKPPKTKNDKSENEKEVDDEILNPKKMVKPTKVIRDVFTNFPNKEFSPTELKEYLTKIKDKNLLIVRSKNLSVTTHAVLRVLLKQNFIVKIDKADGIPMYKKKKDDEIF